MLTDQAIIVTSPGVDMTGQVLLLPEANRKLKNENETAAASSEFLMIGPPLTFGLSLLSETCVFSNCR